MRPETAAVTDLRLPRRREAAMRPETAAVTGPQRPGRLGREA
jgi:hypothetical protein